MVLDGVTLESQHAGRSVWFRNRVEVVLVRWDDTRVWVTSDRKSSAPIDPSLLTWAHSGGW